MDDNPEMFSIHRDRSNDHFERVQECLDAQVYVEDSPLQLLYTWRKIVQEETECYWYHPDHLGSSSWITFSDGKAVEHLHYMPWGEDFVSQRSTNWHTMYTFSAKEKDTETGYSYFGSRYYSSDLSIWLSVDPMSDKYPTMSPYVYCANNPIKLVDPNGEEINPIFSTSGELLGTDSKGWKGKAIVMDKKDFKKGMKHEDALKKGTELDKYGKGIKISDKDWKTVEEKGGERMSPYVENHSGETIYFKPETTYGEYNNEGAYPLEAGKDLYMPVDGIKTSKMKADEVYKIPNKPGFPIQLRGEVWRNGEPNIRNVPLEFLGGKRLGKIKSPDPTWDSLKNCFQ